MIAMAVSLTAAAGLRASHYPGRPEDAVVDVVAFKLLAADR
jgi:hypothetical protein